MNVHFFESEMHMPASVVILPLRCTYVFNSKAGILISPIALSFKQIMEIKSLGPVTDIVAPSLLHHLHVSSAKQHFPDAQLWGPPGVDAICPTLNWQKIFGRDQWPYSEDVEILAIDGIPRMEETAFFVKAKRMLILVDLCFNLQRPRGWAAPFILFLRGTYKRFAVSRLMIGFIKDRPAFEGSLRRILGWDFDQIAMAHGEIVTAGGKALLKKAFRRRGFKV